MNYITHIGIMFASELKIKKAYAGKTLRWRPKRKTRIHMALKESFGI